MQKKDANYGENDIESATGEELRPMISIGECSASALDDTSPLVGYNLNIADKESSLKGSPLKAMKGNS